MRHQKKRHKLGRTASHRKATLQALSASLIAHKRITTTVPKAKALRSFIEPLITRAKEDSQHNRRQVFRQLQDKLAVTTLFTEVSDQVGDRPGGYTRVIKLGRRSGDGAPLAMIELVDYNDVQPDSSGGRRTRRGGGKGRRRRKSSGRATPAPTAQASEASTETTKQVDTAEKGVETETVEKPVAAEQTVDVEARTEDAEVPEEQVEAAQEAVEEQKEAADDEAVAAKEDEDAIEAKSGDAEAESGEAEAKSDKAEAKSGDAEANAETSDEADDADAPEAKADAAGEGDEEAADEDEDKK